MNWTLTITPATVSGRPAYRATLIVNGKTFNWHSRDFASIETQAKAYAESEVGA